MTPPIAQTVPAALRGELARRGISRSEFAERLGVGSDWLYRRLAGTVDISLRDLDRLAEALETTPEEIVAAASGHLVSTGPDRSHGQGPLTPSPSAERNGS